MIDTLDPKIQKMVTNQINYIRRMSILSDDQLRTILLQQIIEHPHLVDNYQEEEQKKMYHDITKAAKDVRTNPIKISRKVA